MPAPGQSQSESYPAVAVSVARVRAAVSAFAEKAGARGERLDAIRLAASEAVTNAVKHSYGGRPGGTINVCTSYVEGELWLLIADSGTGLRAQGKRPGLGLGLMLIAQLADDFQLHSRGGGGTELQMRFKLSSPRPRQGAPAMRS
jgi:anti-sigma regulatory factor (Ser/Thr protein kinase)